MNSVRKDRPTLLVYILLLLLLLIVPLTALAAPQEQYLDFSDDYVEIADGDALDLTGGAFTVSAWIKPTGWGQNNQGRILDHGGGSSGGAGWSLHLENKSSRGSPQALRMQINNSSVYDDMSNSGAIQLGVWQHIAVAYDGGSLTFYVNAVPAGQSTGVPTPLDRDSLLRIGARATDQQRFFDGAIDEVRIWDRALNQQDMFDLMHQELSGLEPGLVAYYPLNANSGQMAADLSSNGHDGQLGSSAASDSRDPVWTGSSPSTNQAPQVSAGMDQVLVWSSDAVNLAGTATDDGLPAATLFSAWSLVSGPATVMFADAASPTTTATFAAPGTYILRLTADDTQLTRSADVSVQLDGQVVLSSIEITPDPVSLLVGATQQFVAMGFDQTGAPISTTPNWSATGGSIDLQTGLYTAGDNVGQFNVTASDNDVTGQASVFLGDSLAPWPTTGWEQATPQEMNLDQTLLEQARDYALTGGGSGYITRHGRLVMSWGSDTQLYDLKSTTKSIGALLLGLAIDDGLVQLDDLAQLHLPDVGVPPSSNTDTGWLEEISVLNLATQTAGFNKSGGFNAMLFQPGTTWAYSDGGVNWLADVVTNVYGQDLRTLAFSRIFTRLGLASSNLQWRNHASRPDLLNGVKRREFSSGISTSVDALARIGYLMLRAGRWETESLISTAFVDQVRAPVPGVAGLSIGNDPQSRFAAASAHYGIMWWNNADGSIEGLPTDAFWAWGLGDSLIVIIPSLDMVISRAGASWGGSRNPSYYQVLEPFLAPIAQAALATSQNQSPTVDAGADQQITLPTNNVTLAGAASDDDLPNGTLTTNWSVISAPGTVAFGDSFALTTTAQFNEAGSYVLRLTANDGTLSSNDEVTISVVPEPDVTAPTVLLSAPVAGPISGVLTLAASASDDVGVASVAFRVDGTVIGIDTNIPYSLIWDSTTVENGTYTITAQAADTSGNTAMGSVVVTVDNGSLPNQAPNVNAGADQQITLPANTISLTGTASDDGLPSGVLSTNWSVVSSPGTVTFSDNSVLATTAQFSTDGLHILRLTADDSALSNSDDLTVTVSATSMLTNIVLSPAQVQLAPGANQQFLASGEDQHGGAIVTDVAWTASGGAIDQNGLYTAGSTAGQFAVTATAGSVSTNASIDISDSAPKQKYLGFSADYVEIADSDALDLSGGAFTISAWINPSDWGQNSQGRIADHGGGSKGNSGWSLHLENKASRGSPKALRFQINNDSGFNGQSSPAAVQLGSWQHVAITHDGDTLTFYVNGMQVGQTAGAPLPNPGSARIRIGARATDQARFFDGAIDDVRVWNIALTAQDVVSQMDSELLGTESGLVAYYQFNENSGQTAADATANANHGRLGTTAGVDATDPSWQP